MDDEVLQISGIQHYAFCPRQWALIHIEQQWADNVRTIGGDIMHDRAHGGPEKEMRGDILTIRGLRVFSHRLNISGTCDVVEFHKDPQGVSIHGTPGLWMPHPVEYKSGEPKTTDADRMQMCAQALCLEEMLVCSIPEGSLYYGTTHRRENVPLDAFLRNMTENAIREMHNLYSQGKTPKAHMNSGCNACSLKDICLPKLPKTLPVAEYIRTKIEDQSL